MDDGEWMVSGKKPKKAKAQSAPERPAPNDLPGWGTTQDDTPSDSKLETSAPSRRKGGKFRARTDDEIAESLVRQTQVRIS